MEKLQIASAVTKDNLDESLVYHEFVKDIHDAILWEKEKIALVSSSGTTTTTDIYYTLMKWQRTHTSFELCYPFLDRTFKYLFRVRQEPCRGPVNDEASPVAGGRHRQSQLDRGGPGGQGRAAGQEQPPAESRNSTGRPGYGERVSTKCDGT